MDCPAGYSKSEAQGEAIQNLERSFAQGRPRALIQMATGSGKTYTAVSFIYRLIKFADAKRVLFLVDRSNLGRQTKKEFQQYITPDDGRKFTELYNVQYLTSNTIDPVSMVCITTIQRLYSMLRGEEEFDAENEFELPVGNGELVLVAEDEDSIREVTVSTLEAYGYKVLTASDGADAIALYAQNKDKIKVILMDMMMPVMDGHTSIKAIRKINHVVKIIAVSGLAEKDKRAKIADTGVHAFLPKPYTAERLLKTIHEVLSGK